MSETSLHRTNRTCATIGKTIEGHSKRYLAKVFIQIMAKDDNASDSHDLVEQEEIARTLVSISENALKSDLLPSKFEIMPEHQPNPPAVPESPASPPIVPEKDQEEEEEEEEEGEVLHGTQEFQVPLGGEENP